MDASYIESPLAAKNPPNTLWLARERVLGTVALAAILIVAAVLRFANLSALGYANHYYTAGIESMLQSWHNFFYVAAEPGGAVSIDKPPVGLWLQAISAYIFGLNGFAVLLPEIIAGILSVLVLYHLVRRSFGTVAGLLAALALAITPIVVATDRNNTIDSPLILTLLLATWAFIKATESGRLRYLILGAALVGIGFNIKMLQAYLPLPALYALYFVGASESLRRKLLNLTITTLVLVAVSFSWAVAVDLTPADQRPYVGSSGDNSVMSLIFGYNGLERLTGMGGGAPGNGLLGNGQSRPNVPQSGNGQFPQPGNGQLQPPTGNGQFQGPGQGGANGGFGSPNGGFGSPDGGIGRGGGFPGTGQPGLLRLFTTPLSKEVSWLLPFGLISIGLLFFSTRWQWPFSAAQQTAVLWGGWLVTGGVFFSVAGFFHEYYLSMLAAPLAALVAIGAVVLWRLIPARPWLAVGLLIGAAGLTLGLQLVTAHAFVGLAWWLIPAIALFGSGAIVLVVTAARQSRIGRLSGFVSVVAALLIIPGIWAGLTTFNSSDNQSLPAAYSGRTSGPSNRGSVQINQNLLAYLEANTQGMKYLMAVPSSMQGADYVIATGRPVLYTGGFMGQDKVVTAEDLAQLVAEGQLRYIYWDASDGNGFGGGQGNESDVSGWVTTACTPVAGFEAATQNSGAPDGTNAAGNTNSLGGSFGGRAMRVTLYDCAGAG